MDKIMPRTMQHCLLIVFPLVACLLAISNAKATFQQPTEPGKTTTVTVDALQNNGTLSATIVRSPDALAAESGLIGDVEISFVPEMGLVITTGKKVDVQRVNDLIAQIKKQSAKSGDEDEDEDEDEDMDDEDEGDDEDEDDEDEEDDDRDRKKSDKHAKSPGKMPKMNVPSPRVPMQMPAHSPMHIQRPMQSPPMQSPPMQTPPMQMPGMQMPAPSPMHMPAPMYMPTPSPMHGQNLHHAAQESANHAESLELLRNINRSLQSIESMMREEKAMERAERQRTPGVPDRNWPNLGQMPPMPPMNRMQGRPNPRMQQGQAPRNFRPEFGGPNRRGNGDGPRNDGPRNDGPRNNGPRNDGPRNDGPRNDGPRNDGPRNDGPRNDGPRMELPRFQ
jgi:hypothetical protein